MPKQSKNQAAASSTSSATLARDQRAQQRQVDQPPPYQEAEEQSEEEVRRYDSEEVETDPNDAIADEPYQVSLNPSPSNPHFPRKSPRGLPPLFPKWSRIRRKRTKMKMRSLKLRWRMRTRGRGWIQIRIMSLRCLPKRRMLLLWSPQSIPEKEKWNMPSFRRTPVPMPLSPLIMSSPPFLRRSPWNTVGR